MAGIRALQKRLARLEDAGKSKPSLISVWYGSFDAWVEQDVLPGVESGALDSEIWLILSSFCAAGKRTGLGSAHMLADGAPAWLLSWQEGSRECSFHNKIGPYHLEGKE